MSNIKKIAAFLSSAAIALSGLSVSAFADSGYVSQPADGTTIIKADLPEGGVSFDKNGVCEWSSDTDPVPVRTRDDAEVKVSEGDYVYLSASAYDNVEVKIFGTIEARYAEYKSASYWFGIIPEGTAEQTLTVSGKNFWGSNYVKIKHRLINIINLNNGAGYSFDANSECSGKDKIEIKENDSADGEAITVPANGYVRVYFTDQSSSGSKDYEVNLDNSSSFVKQQYGISGLNYYEFESYSDSDVPIVISGKNVIINRVEILSKIEENIKMSSFNENGNHSLSTSYEVKTADGTNIKVKKGGYKVNVKIAEYPEEDFEVNFNYHNPFTFESGSNISSLTLSDSALNVDPYGFGSDLVLTGENVTVTEITVTIPPISFEDVDNWRSLQGASTRDKGDTYEFTPSVYKNSSFEDDMLKAAMDVVATAPKEAFSNDRTFLSVQPTAVTDAKASFDIKFSVTDEETHASQNISPLKPVTVYIPVPKKMSSNSSINVFHTENGKYVKVDNVEFTSVNYCKYVKFNASSFSDSYTISTTDLSGTEDTDTSDGTPSTPSKPSDDTPSSPSKPQESTPTSPASPFDQTSHPSHVTVTPDVTTTVPYEAPIPTQSLTDETTGITVSGAISEEISLKVDNTESTDNLVTYDITLTDKNGNTVQPTGKVEVRLPIPERFNDKPCFVYRVESDNSYTDMKAKVENGCLVFTTDHFSKYVISLTALSGKSEEQPDKNVSTGFSITILPAVAAAIGLIITKKK